MTTPFTLQVAPGEEKHTVEYSRSQDGLVVNYVYRHPTLGVFSTVAPDLKTAQRRRDEWLCGLGPYIPPTV